MNNTITFDGKEYTMRKATYPRVEAVEKLIGSNGQEIGKRNKGNEVLKIIFEDFTEISDEISAGEVLEVVQSFFLSAITTEKLLMHLKKNSPESQETLSGTKAG